MDRDGSSVPSLTESVVSASRSGLAVKVRHAQDVDLRGFEADELVPPAQAHVHIHVCDRPQADALFSGDIDVPSGVLTVGDAEQVDCAPREVAEDARVWLRAV